MSKHDGALSKSQQQMLNAFKSQLTQEQRQQQRAELEASQRAATQQAEAIDDATLFAQAVQGVKKNPNVGAVVVNKTKPRKPDAQILAKRAAAMGGAEFEMNDISDTQAILNPVASQASLSYRIATLQHRVFEDLKAGKLRWYEAVDLHGCTVEQSRSAVIQVIEMAKQANQTVVKIVHGKGPDAVLKTYVNGWLRQHRDVLAFVSAPENQGGTGAVLVLLKRQNKENSPSHGRE